MSRPLKVLLVEEVVSDAELVLAMLRRAGYTLDWTLVDNETDYITALGNNPEIVLCDYNLPQFDALQALDLLHERGLDIPFIIISGTIGEELAAQAILRGATNYLPKDRLDRLGPAIEGTLERFRLQAENRATNDALLASERDHRMLFEQAADGIIVADVDARVLTVNSRMSAMLGYAADEIIGRPIIEFIDSDNLTEHPMQVEQLHAGMTVVNERILRRSDGTLLPVETNSKQFEDGRIQVIARDITERKQSEDALRAAEARYRTLVEQLPAAMYTEDAATGVTTYISPQVEHLTGFTPESLMTGIDSWMRVIHPDDRSRCQAEMARAAETGAPFTMEFRVPTGDGQVVWLREEAVLIAREGGEPAHWQGFLVDISERKRAEASTAELAAIVANATDAITSADADGRTTIWNHGAEQLYGYRADEALGQPVGFIIPEERRDENVTARARIMAGEPAVRFETQHRVKDGTLIDVRMSVTPMRDAAGRITGTSAISYDITERKRAEEALLAAESRFRALVEHSPAATYVEQARTDGFTVYISPQIERMTGYPPEDFLTGIDFWLQIIHPDDRPRFQAELARTDASGQPFELEFRCLTKDGRTVWLRNEAVLVQEADGQGMLWQGVMTDITARRIAQDAADTTATHLKAVLDNAVDAILTIDPEGTIENVNPATETMFGYSSHELIGRNVRLLMPEPYHSEHDGYLERYHRTGEARIIGMGREVHGLRRDGSVFPIDLAVSRIEVDGRVVFNGRIADISERKRSEELILQSEARFRLLADHAGDVVFLHEFLPESRTVYVSPSTFRITGYTPEEYYAAPELQFALVHPDDRPLLEQLQSPNPPENPVTVRWVRKDGETIWIELVTNLLRDDAGTITAIHGVARDITERKQFEQQLEQQMFFDALTGLPNRALFQNRLDHAIAKAVREETTVAVLVFDLGSLAAINESLGHAAGDTAIKLMVDRVTSSVRKQDTVSRLSGHEFAILIDDVQQPSVPVDLATRVIAEVQTPIAIEGAEVALATNVGIAIERSTDGAPTRLLRDASTALLRSKSNGRGRFEIFDPSMQSRAVQQLALGADLRHAIERAELRVVFQPIVDLASSAIVGAEALVRWQHPERGLLAPGAFIPLAEESGLLVQIDRFVLVEAVHRAHVWSTLDNGGRSLFVSVNVGAIDLRQPDLVSFVASVLADSGVAPAQLQLELTETSLLENATMTQQTLDELKQLGVTLAIDDFGTGFSSLSYLTQFPVDVVKIDRSFVSGPRASDRMMSIVTGIANLCHALDLRVTAEGIETTGQLARTRFAGCDHGQGYFFSRPVPPAELEAMLRTDVAEQS